MNISEYIKTLPSNIMNGDDVTLPDVAVRRMLDFAGLKSGQRFCHLGCGTGYALRVASGYGAAVSGIDSDPQRVAEARRTLGSDADITLGDITQCKLPDADVILFWFADPEITHIMPQKFATLPHDTKIITIWGPLAGCLPDSVQFPYILSTIPLRQAPDMRSQILAVFGVECISYATAWEFAERYTRALQPESTQNDRFLTILQALTIWFQAHSLGMACEKDIPDPVRNYTHIMRDYFGINFM